MKIISKEQVQSALTKASTEKQMDYYWMIFLLANTGLRNSELRELVPANINTEEKILTVMGKRKIIRYIDVSDDVINLLLKIQKEKKLSPGQRYFTYSRKHLWYITKKVAGVHPHAFRHYYAIQLLRLTKNIRYVQKQLGHRKINTTMIYLQFMDYKDEKALLNKLVA